MGFSKSTYFQLLEQRQIEAALEYRTSFTPDFLYKFFWLDEITDKQADFKLVESNEKKFSTLGTNQLWFSLPEYLNDPYEVVGMYFDREKLISYGFKSDVLDSIVSLIRNIPICCFVANSSANLPMWAHYANNHKGYCVKYKVNRKRNIRSIMYEPQRIPIASIFASFLSAADNFDKGICSSENVHFYSTLLQEMLFIKHDSWISENEYRIVHPSDKIMEKGVYVDVSEVGLEVLEIICGYQCAKEHIKRLDKIASSLSVPCRKCALSETEFTVYSEV